MPTATERLRKQAEEEWAARLASVFSDQYDELVDELESERPVDPPPGWWDEWGTTIAAFLGVSLMELTQMSAELEISRVGISVNWDNVLNAAQNWTSSYTFDLVRGINTRSQQALQGLLNNYYSGKIDYDTMVSMLESRFGPTRAASIATSEVTRGVEQGIDIYQQELEALGIETDRIWYTEPGACELCAPYDGVLESEGWYDGPPPLHPRCACHSEIILLPGTRSYREWLNKNGYLILMAAKPQIGVVR